MNVKLRMESHPPQNTQSNLMSNVGLHLTFLDFCIAHFSINENDVLFHVLYNYNKTHENWSHIL